MIEVKICENCNHRNLVTAVECEKCGYDLTFVYPKMVNENEENANDGALAEESSLSSSDAWVICSTSNSDAVYEVNQETSVGRDCEVFKQQFNSSNFTSRIHAKIRVSDGIFQVMDASTNGTFVDDKRIPKMEWVNVNEGSIVTFADISFRVSRRK